VPTSSRDLSPLVTFPFIVGYWRQFVNRRYERKRLARIMQDNG
jgi:hypothetical protein